MDDWQDFQGELKPEETYLCRTEKMLYRRLWAYIIGENWAAVGQVVQTLRNLFIV